MSNFITDVLQTVAKGQVLDVQTAEDFMRSLMSGQITAVQTAGLLSGMAVRGEAVSEIVGFARAMRNQSVHLNAPRSVVDTCGTGGDGSNTFNISTAAAVVAAASGVPMAKHGNRAVSSRSGSADVLTALGARVNLSTDEALSCLNETNLCFLFAQSYHPAMKHAAEPRRQLGFRTIFNILGPLTNPAGAKRQVVGVFKPELVDKVAEALLELGTEHALVVHGAGGIDEFSLQGETLVAEVKQSSIRRYTVTPGESGLKTADVSELVGGDAEANAAIIQSVLSGKTGPCRDVVLLNASAVLYVAGRVTTLREGVTVAAAVIDSGAAARTLESFVHASHHCGVAEVAQ